MVANVAIILASLTYKGRLRANRLVCVTTVLTREYIICSSWSLDLSRLLSQMRGNYSLVWICVKAIGFC